MEIEGKIILDLPEEGGQSARTGNPWRRKSWVLETFGQYPRKVYFIAFNDRIDNLHIQVGKTYKVSVDAESREYNGRWYTDLRAYSAQEVAEPTFGGQAPQPVAPAAPAAPAAAPFSAPQAPAADPFSATPASADPFGSSSETDDLPF